MGNCGTIEAHKAIKMDGEQNVKNAAILTANQNFLDNYLQQLKPSLLSQFKKQQELKFAEIADSKKIIEQKFQQKKLQLEKQETGSVHYLQKRHFKSFEDLSGYAQAVSSINDFQKRAQEACASSTKTLMENINKYKEDLKFEMEKLKQPLPALMAFGQEQKENILAEVAKHHHQEIQASNKKLQQQAKAEFSCQQLYRKKIEEWVPQSQLNTILENFEKQLQNLHAKKAGFLGWF